MPAEGTPEYNYPFAPEDVLQLEPEDLAGYLMERIAKRWAKDPTPFHRDNFITAYPHPDQEVEKRVWRALTCAWMWLEREGFLAPEPRAGSHGWVFVTPRGEKYRDVDLVKEWCRASLLPKRLLHPILAPKVWATFRRGDYDTAVFQAFKEVEVSVRTAGRFSDSDYGRDLMIAAFRPSNGRLTDRAADPSEQDARFNLFLGAIGAYKNPGSHRHTAYSPEEAVELLLLASHLMRIVDSRSPPDPP